jgi:hypothetical protein
METITVGYCWDAQGAHKYGMISTEQYFFSGSVIADEDRYSGENEMKHGKGKQKTNTSISSSQLFLPSF